ncbi:hypothetical protein Pmi06nite_64040 [Planotetraspora mira]|uniref:Uncharacterized protein n=1 Tax=Planotetraspora mira TaxID=58121 RepID=A0A8J3X987_9ACTN|nr:hypothetical protein Pmi06nite_64040 [Planotetraspora mira]
MAEQREAGPAVHLAHDALGFRVDAFGAAVVEGQGDGRVDGVAVVVEAVGEGVQVRQIAGPGGGDSRIKTVGVVLVWP